MSLGRVWVYWILGALAALLLALPTLGTATAAVGDPPKARRALVIGIDGYTDKDLSVAGNRTSEDARQIAEVLKDVAGYQTVVTVPSNADKRTFSKYFLEFSKQVQPGDLVVVFYSGHGIEFEGQNYLLMADAESPLPRDNDETREALKFTALSQQGLLQDLKFRHPGNIILIINACRDTVGPGATLGDGDIEIPAPSARGTTEAGTMVIYATSSGKPAQVCLKEDCADDPSPMTVFPRRLVEALRQPNLTVESLVGTVGEQVYDDVQQSLGETQLVSFDSQIAPPVKKSLYLGPIGDPPAPDQEPLRFLAATSTNTIDGWSAFLTDFPDGQFASRARSALNLLKTQEEANRFTVAANLDTVEAWSAFLRDYPIGKYSAPAEIRRQALLEPPRPTRYLATYNDLDFFGSDIASAHAGSFEACATTCERYEGCTAFTFNNNTKRADAPNCFLKNSTGQVYPFPAAFSGVIFDLNDENAPTFDFDSIESENRLFADTDITFHDFSNDPLSGVHSLAGCRLACLKDSSCEAFSYVVKLKQCWPKTTDGPTSYKAGIITGVKESFSRAPVEVRDLSK